MYLVLHFLPISYPFFTEFWTFSGFSTVKFSQSKRPVTVLRMRNNKRIIAALCKSVLALLPHRPGRARIVRKKSRPTSKKTVLQEWLKELWYSTLASTIPTSGNHGTSLKFWSLVVGILFKFANDSKWNYKLRDGPVHTPPQCSLTLGILLALPLATSNYKGFASKTELVVLVARQLPLPPFTHYVTFYRGYWTFSRFSTLTFSH